VGLNQTSIVIVAILIFISLLYYLKITLLKVLVRSYFIMMQGTFLWQNVRPLAETWCLKAKTTAKLNSTEMDFWRCSARISRKDKIRNNVIKKKMNMTRSLLEDIKTKQLQWYGHVQRMEEGRLPKEELEWRPSGRRKRGSPKLTWAEGIRGMMGEKGLKEEDWADRNNWRRKIA